LLLFGIQMLFPCVKIWAKVRISSRKFNRKNI